MKNLKTFIEKEQNSIGIGLRYTTAAGDDVYASEYGDNGRIWCIHYDGSGEWIHYEDLTLSEPK